METPDDFDIALLDLIQKGEINIKIDEKVYYGKEALALPLKVLRRKDIAFQITEKGIEFLERNKE